MTVGSLCAGIGGFDLGFERAGMTVRWQVEIDPFCRKVLTKHWPNVKRYEDLTTLTGDELEPVDLVCAGFPCQPVSVAGARKGQADERWIWPHIARLLGVLRPRWVVLENTPGLFTAGSRFIESPESTFGAVLGDLAALGFDCEYETVSAQDLGAPHLRKRVWIVAHARHSGVLQRRLSGDVEEQGVFAGGVLCDGVQSGRANKEKVLPTPTAGDSTGSGNRNNAHSKAHPGISLTDAALTGDSSTPRSEVSGKLNPTFVEYLMGYPIGWTDLKDSATPSSRRSPSGSAGASSRSSDD